MDILFRNLYPDSQTQMRHTLNNKDGANEEIITKTLLY